ncbi:MAG TPA: ATPase, partial [Epsilonproteobacteria bacterium]|nr:ATPase [Campylobacterota bacterium]
MAQKAIREYDGKAIFAKHWNEYFDGFHYGFKSVLVTSGDELKEIAKKHGFEWLNQEALVAKPDMLFGKRGKNDLVLFRTTKPGDVTLDEAATWIDEKQSHEVTLLSGEKGHLTHFIVEPFTPHTQDQEYYISATTVGEDDVLYMSAEGGMEVEEGWDEKVNEVHIPINMPDADMEKAVKAHIPADIPDANKTAFASFAIQFFKFYRDMNFAYLEINPIVMLDNGEMAILDLVARLDDTAGFMMADAWGDIEFPTAFGMEDQSKEEKAIAE